VGKSEVPIHSMTIDTGKEIPFEMKSFDVVCSTDPFDLLHRHSFYEILYITGGKGVHTIDFESYTIKYPSMFFISPGQVHYWDIKVPIEGCVIMFNSDFLTLTSSMDDLLCDLSFFDSIEQAPHLKLNKKNNEAIAHLVEILLNEYNADRFGRGSLLRSYLHILLVNIQRIVNKTLSAKTAHHSQTIARRFKRLVVSECYQQRSVEVFAKRLGVSSGHLRDTIKATTGYTPGQIIRQTQALEAKRLLMHTNKTVTEIGYSLNFDDPSYFVRFFKRETGVKPGQFRLKMRRNPR